MFKKNKGKKKVIINEHSTVNIISLIFLKVNRKKKKIEIKIKLKKT